MFIFVNNNTKLTYVCCKDLLFKTPTETSVGIVDFYFKIIKTLRSDLNQLNVGVRNFIEFLELFIYNLEDSECTSTALMENTFNFLTNN